MYGGVTSTAHTHCQDDRRLEYLCLEWNNPVQMVTDLFHLTMKCQFGPWYSIFMMLCLY